MDKNANLNKFILRLILITHILLTAKLPTDYLGMFNNIGGRVMLMIAIIGLSFYDIYATLLVGFMMIFSNMEYINRVNNVDKFEPIEYLFK